MMISHWNWRKCTPYNPEKKQAPEYKSDMVNTHTQSPMGKIRLRVGLTEMLRQYGGHIGYEAGTTLSRQRNPYALAVWRGEKRPYFDSQPSQIH